MWYLAVDSFLGGCGDTKQMGEKGAHLLTSDSLPYLHHLSEPSTQDGQEDTSDTDVVSRLGYPCVLSFHQHGDATRDISHRNLVTLQGRRVHRQTERNPRSTRT